jgi:iron complex outermembrane receptor protein
VLVTNNTFLTIVVKEDNVSLEEIIVIESRNPNRSIIDSLLSNDTKELVASTLKVNFYQILNFVQPSFISEIQTISNATDRKDSNLLIGCF